jgi:hypothetical protein
VIIRWQHRQPNEVSFQPFIGNVFQNRLHVGEPPTACRSSRRKLRDQANVSAVAFKCAF